MQNNLCFYLKKNKQNKKQIYCYNSFIHSFIFGSTCGLTDTKLAKIEAIADHAVGKCT